ncbi:MAG: AAA family ATPase [Nocardioidaceae bacterium]
MPCPYSPGAGKPPRWFAGRHEALDLIHAELQQVAFYGDAAGEDVVFLGARGLGKTSLLSVISARAADDGFTVGSGMCGPGRSVIDALAVSLVEAASAAGVGGDRRSWRDRLQTIRVELSAVGPKVGAEWDMADTETAAAQLSQPGFLQLVTTAAQLCRENNRPGVVLLVDELQEGSGPELNALMTTTQQLAAQRTPVTLVGAGLPNSTEVITRAASSSERVRFEHIDRLTRPNSLEALLRPAEQAGVTWSREAADRVIDSSQGYPYFLQLFGKRTWMNAQPEAGDVIAPASAEDGVRAAEQTAAEGVFAQRYGQATPTEQKFLQAMAKLAGPSSDPVRMADIGSELEIGRPAGLSPQRASLISKGIIAPAGHGFVQFTVPGFAAYVLHSSGA